MLATLLAGALLLQAAAPAASPAKAETVRRYASNATQGVAVGPNDVWAVSNFRLTRYDKKTGEQKAEWVGNKARFPHINSCASSNFPGTPHVSTVEVFEPQTLAHKRSIALGLGTGSITWVDRKDGFWWAMFANYDGKGGESPRDHKHTTLVKFDDQWRRAEAFALPPTVLEKIAPMSVSGGGFGPDGRLYLSGHDLPELYVMALPTAGGGVLEHLATISMEAEGQALDWDESQPGMLYGITRRSREILAMKVPVEK